MTLHAPAALVALACSGCVLPFAAPPLEVVGDVGARRADRPSPEATAGGTFLARPLAAFGSLHDRPVDAGLGVRVEHGGRVGSAAELRGFFVDHVSKEGGHTRGGASFEARALVDERDRLGLVGTVRVLGELMTPQRGVCGESHDRKALLAGCASGEWALGAFLETSYGELGGVPVRAIGAGVSVRLPAVAAIGIVSK